MANEYPFRPNIGPGTITVTADPNNPWGGQITDQNMNMSNPDETPAQAIVRLYQGGLAIDEIAQMTGFPPDQVAMQVAAVSGDRDAFMPGGQFGRQDENPLFDQYRDQNIGIGIESLYRDTDTTELSDYVDQGNSITDLVSQEVLNIEAPDPSSYLDESMMVQTLENMGVDLDDEDADILDEEDDPLKKLISASAVGATANGLDDPDAVKTLNTMTQMNMEFNSDDPDDIKAQLEVYKNAAEIFYDTDDLKDLIPQPDKALPFMIAGAALIQAGNKGDTWGEALSSAFLHYAMTSKKEEKAYEKTMLGLEVQERRAVQDMAVQLYLADWKEQKALARSMLTADVQLYKIEGYDNPVPLTDYELLQIRETGQYTILSKWTDTDGVLKNFTLTDASGNQIVKAITDTEATRLKDTGKYANIQVGNQLSGMKLYNVDGVNEMLLPADARKLQTAGKEISIARSRKMIEAYDTESGLNAFIDEDIIANDTKVGTSRYIPIDKNLAFAFDENGNPVVGSANMVFGVLGQKETGKIVTDFQDLYTIANFNRNRILTTIDEIRGVINTAEESGAPIFFGTAGELGKAGRRVINEINQLGKLFSGKDKGWRFYKSTKENGKYDPNTDKVHTYNTFKDSFGLGDYVDNSGFGKFLVNSGLKKKEAENLIFQLALTSAMLEGQKGRDISDKDIERFLTRAGSYANSERELRTLIDNLEFNAIDYVDKLADNHIRLSPAKMKNPDGDGTVNVLDYHFSDIITADSDYRPTDITENIGERRERLRSRREVPTSGGVATNVIGSGNASTPLPGGNELSGDGQRTVHQVYEHYKLLDTAQQLGYTAKLRNSLGQDSPEYQTIVDYIKRISAGQP
jgi:hypothetical protein